MAKANKTIHTILSGVSSTRVEHQGEIVVIGLGRFGSSLAHTLTDMGYEVLGIDFSEEKGQEHAGTLTHVVQADTTSERALRQVGVADAVTVMRAGRTVATRRGSATSGDELVGLVTGAIAPDSEYQ